MNSVLLCVYMIYMHIQQISLIAYNATTANIFQ